MLAILVLALVGATADEESRVARAAVARSKGPRSLRAANPDRNDARRSLSTEKERNGVPTGGESVV